jgi:hypothetical protein
MLTEFCGAVQKRLGSGWSDLLTLLLPAVLEMLQNCFPQAADLQRFAEGERRPLQLAGLHQRCRRVAQENGVRGPFRLRDAANQLQAAVLAELDATAQRAAGPGIYQDAIDEAMSV